MAYGYGIDPYYAFTAGKTALGILGNYATQEAARDSARKYDWYLQNANALISNPALAYEKDPGLLQMRKMRMADVRAGQLARGGGLRGGNYSRQLMKEGTAIDAAVLQRAIDAQLRMAGQYAPAAEAYKQAGGGTGMGLGAIVGPLSQGVSDAAWKEMLKTYGGNVTLNVAPPSSTVSPSYTSQGARNNWYNSMQGSNQGRTGGTLI